MVRCSYLTKHGIQPSTSTKQRDEAQQLRRYTPTPASDMQPLHVGTPYIVLFRTFVAVNLDQTQAPGAMVRNVVTSLVCLSSSSSRPQYC